MSLRGVRDCFSESEYARSVVGYMLSNVTVFPFNGFKYFCVLDLTFGEADVT